MGVAIQELKICKGCDRIHRLRLDNTLVFGTSICCCVVKPINRRRRGSPGQLVEESGTEDIRNMAATTAMGPNPRDGKDTSLIEDGSTGR